MPYKVSKDYKRLKQLLDEGNKVVCFVDYGFERSIPLINLSIIKKVSSGQLFSYQISNFEHVNNSIVLPYNSSTELLYKIFEYHNVRFIDPDYERNTLEFELK